MCGCFCRPGRSQHFLTEGKKIHKRSSPNCWHSGLPTLMCVASFASAPTFNNHEAKFTRFSWQLCMIPIMVHLLNQFPTPSFNMKPSGGDLIWRCWTQPVCWSNVHAGYVSVSCETLCFPTVIDLHMGFVLPFRFSRWGDAKRPTGARQPAPADPHTLDWQAGWSPEIYCGLQFLNSLMQQLGKTNLEKLKRRLW